MNSVEKALWFIENRLAGELSLQAIAQSAGVSNHHLARTFGAATGQSLMRYARGRRLSEATRALSAGAPDILAVALSAGYGSIRWQPRCLLRLPQREVLPTNRSDGQGLARPGV
jgi:AraC family transcriptional regulator